MLQATAFFVLNSIYNLCSESTITSLQEKTSSPDIRPRLYDSKSRLLRHHTSQCSLLNCLPLQNSVKVTQYQGKKHTTFCIVSSSVPVLVYCAKSQLRRGKRGKTLHQRGLKRKARLVTHPVHYRACWPHFNIVSPHQQLAQKVFCPVAATTDQMHRTYWPLNNAYNNISSEASRVGESKA
jgi:hypothetical protein